MILSPTKVVLSANIISFGSLTSTFIDLKQVDWEKSTQPCRELVMSYGTYKMTIDSYFGADS